MMHSNAHHLGHNLGHNLGHGIACENANGMHCWRRALHLVHSIVDHSPVHDMAYNLVQDLLGACHPFIAVLGAEERIGVEEALRAVTVDAAYLGHMEHSRGTIQVLRSDLSIIRHGKLIL